MKLLPFLLLASPVFAQYKADVKPTQPSGYQRIDLSSEVLGRLNDGLGDVRLYDGEKREIPYLLIRKTGTEGTAFLPFTIIEKTSIAHAGTTLIAKRPNQQPIRAISVVIKNTDVHKSASLSGSPDGQRWYALDNAVSLGGKSSSTGTVYTETLSFPLTDYPYFQLQINDSTAAPLNIVRMGVEGQTTASAQYMPIPGLRFRQIDSSDHHTYLFISRLNPARLDRLSIRVGSPAQFRRRAEFGQVFTQTVIRKRSQRRVMRSFEPEVGFVLSSAGNSALALPSVLTEKLCIRIDNGNDPPLQIRAIEAAQITTYLVANLLADSTYTLQFGDRATTAPVYDLAYFKDKLPVVLPVATVGPVQDFHKSTQSQPYHLMQYALWVAIGVVLLLLGFMSYQMLGRVDQRRTENTTEKG